MKYEIWKYGDRLDSHVHIWTLQHSSEVPFRYFKLNFIDHPSVLYKVIFYKIKWLRIRVRERWNKLNIRWNKGILHQWTLFLVYMLMVYVVSFYFISYATHTHVWYLTQKHDTIALYLKISITLRWTYAIHVQHYTMYGPYSFNETSK